MKKTYKNMKEIIHEYNMIEKKPSKLMIVFLYIVIFSIVAIFIWSWIGKVDDFIIADGIVKPVNQLFSVKSEVAGRITSVNIIDGMMVKEGELLYKINSESLENDKEKYTEKLNEELTRLNNLSNLHVSIKQNHNYLENKNISGVYYDRFLSYQLYFDNIDSNYKELIHNINELQDETRKLELIKKSVIANTNLLNPYDQSFFSRLTVFYDEMDNFILNEILYQNSINEYDNFINSYKLVILQDTSEAKEALSNTVTNYIVDGVEYKTYEKYKNETLLINERNIQETTVEIENLSFDINHSELKYFERQDLKEKYETKRIKYENLIKFRESITKNNNLFDSMNENEIFFYNSFINYQLNYKIEKNFYDKNINETNRLSQKIDNLVLLREAINVKKNLFQVGTEYYYIYNKYDNNIAYLEGEIDKYKDKLFEKDDYRNKFILNINNEIYEKEKAIEEYEFFLNQSNDYEKEKSKYKIDTLLIISIEIENCENMISEYENRIINIDVEIEKNSITAHCSGEINILYDIRVGDIIQGGRELATIVPESTEYFVELYVNNKDISSVYKDQIVKVQLDALPYKEYGEAYGKVIFVSSDSIISDNRGNFYLVKALIEPEALIGYNGLPGEIKTGMVCRTRFIKGSQKVLFAILEKLNLRN